MNRLALVLLPVVSAAFGWQFAESQRARAARQVFENAYEDIKAERNRCETTLRSSFDGGMP